MVFVEFWRRGLRAVLKDEILGLLPTLIQGIDKGGREGGHSVSLDISEVLVLRVTY